MTFNKHKPSLIILSLTSIALLAVIIFGSYNIQNKNKRASELLNLADQSAELEAKAQSIRTVKNIAVADLATFESMTLSGTKLVPLIESIEGVGKALALETIIISVAKVEDQEPTLPDMIRIVIETNGPWAETLTFFRAMESLPHRVIIDESSVSKSELDWHSRIVLSLYSFN